MSSSSGDIFVGNLSLFTTSYGLSLYFSQFGVVSSVRLLHHRDSLKSRRYGFVTFQNARDAEKVVFEASAVKHYLDGHALDVKRAVRSVSANDEVDRKIFVHGLCDGVDEGVLKKHFEAAVGQVEGVVVPKSGYAFVTFVMADAAAFAIQTGSYSINGCEVRVKAAKPRKRQPTSPSNAVGLLGPHPFEMYYFNVFYSQAMSQQLTLQQKSPLPTAAAARSSYSARFIPYPLKNE